MGGGAFRRFATERVCRKEKQKRVLNPSRQSLHRNKNRCQIVDRNRRAFDGPRGAYQFAPWHPYFGAYCFPWRAAGCRSCRHAHWRTPAPPVASLDPRRRRGKVAVARRMPRKNRGRGRGARRQAHGVGKTPCAWWADICHQQHAGASVLVMHLVGRQAAVPPEVSDTALRRDQVRQLLSGEYHREPLKNRISVPVGCGVWCAMRAARRPPAPDCGLPDPAAASVLVPPAPHPHFWEVSADARGQAAIAGLPAGAFLVLATRAGDHAVARVDVGEGSGIAEAILVLSPNAPRAGTVKDRAGAPVAGATVTPLSARDWAGVTEPYRALQAGTDKERRVHPAHLPPGEWNLFVAAPGLAPAPFARKAPGRSRRRPRHGRDHFRAAAARGRAC